MLKPTHLRRGLVLAVSGVALTAGLAFAAPLQAVAAPTTGSTNVTVIGDPSKPGGGDQAAITVPTEISFAVAVDGSLIAPSADALTITNNSAFKIKVTNVKFTTDKEWHVDDSVKQAQSLTFTFGPEADKATLSAYSTDAGRSITSTAWNMEAKPANGNGGKIQLTAANGKINVGSQDISSKTKVGSFTFTADAGAHA